MENLESKWMWMNKVPLLKAMRDWPSWHKILQILQKTAIYIFICKTGLLNSLSSTEDNLKRKQVMWMCHGGTFTLKY